MNKMIGLFAILLFTVACGDEPKITYNVKMLEGSPSKVTIVYNEHLKTNSVEVEVPWTHSFTADGTESLYVGAVVSNDPIENENLSVRVAIEVDGDETKDASGEGIDNASATATGTL